MLKLITILSLSFLLAMKAEASCAKAYMYFDLGQTLVDTDTNNYNPMFYFKLDANKYRDGREHPTSKSYVDELVKLGHKLGILADIPGAWGVNYPAQDPVRDLPTAKVLRTMDFLAGVILEDGASWAGEAFDWSPFVMIHGQGAARIAHGRLLLPQTNEERKKTGSLVVFERAQKIAKDAGCQAVFQGEQEKEMESAEKAGMIPFWVGHTISGQFFLGAEQIDDYVSSYRPGDWRGKSTAR
jgi:hypothetical protein